MTEPVLRAVDAVTVRVPDLDAVARLVSAGATVIAEPADIPVGRVAVVLDPFGNALVLVDLSKGTYRTDAGGRVTGVDSE